MTNRELIEKLQKLPKDAEVVMSDGIGHFPTNATCYDNEEEFIVIE
jgi:hypothetical protein